MFIPSLYEQKTGNHPDVQTQKTRLYFCIASYGILHGILYKNENKLELCRAQLNLEYNYEYKKANRIKSQCDIFKQSSKK